MMKLTGKTARRLPLVLIAAVAVLLSIPSLALAHDDDDDDKDAPQVRKIVVKHRGAWLGIGLAGGDEDSGRGVRVIQVFDGSPAEEVGLEEGDRVVEIDGVEIGDVADLMREVGEHKPGDEVRIHVLRDGDEKTFRVELADRHEEGIAGSLDPEEAETLAEKMKDLYKRMPELEGLKGLMPLASGQVPRVYVGILMQDINPELREHFGAPEGKGFLIAGVKKDSPARQAGLNVGDVVIAADGEDLEEPSDLTKLLADRKPGDKLELTVVRDGRTRSFELTLADRPEGSKGFGEGGSFGPGKVEGFGPNDKDITIRRAPRAARGEQELSRRLDALERQLDELSQRLERLTRELNKNGD